MWAFCSTSSTVVPRARISPMMRNTGCTISGREAERGFVEQQQARLGHQAARDRDHLLLPARQRPAERIGERPDIGEELEHGVGLARELRRSTALAVRGAEHDVFAHGQAGENAPPLRHVRDAEAHDRLRARGRAIGLPSKQDCPRPRRDQAGDRAQRRRFAGAVGAEQRDDSPSSTRTRRPAALRSRRSGRSDRRLQAAPLSRLPR